MNANGALFFSADDGTHGRELWKSDGTAGGTVLVADINPRSAGSYPISLANMNGTLFFAANDGTHGVELWKSDGTAAGTVLVKDISPGTAWSYPAHLTNVKGTLYFSANDGMHGTELWQSNGTAAGTVLVADINPGSASSNPANLTLAGTHLFFTADDGSHGTELWDPPIAPLPGTDTVQSPNGISSSVGHPLVIALPDESDAGVALLATGVTPLNGPRPDGTYRPAADRIGAPPAPPADWQSTAILDHVFAESANQPRMSRFALATDPLWGSDLLEDWAFSWQVG